MKKKRGGNTNVVPFSTFGFKCKGTTPAEDAKLCLQKKAEAQNKLNQLGGDNLKCNDDLDISDVVIPQFFIANPVGPVDSNLLSKTGNETNLKSISQSEFDHLAFSGGKKVKKNRRISQKKSKKGFGKYSISKKKQLVPKSKKNKKTIKIKKIKKIKKNGKGTRTLKVIKRKFR